MTTGTRTTGRWLMSEALLCWSALYAVTPLRDPDGPMCLPRADWPAAGRPVMGDDVRMGYRPFGRFRQVGGYPVGDQWPDAPDDIRRTVGGPAQEWDYNRFERAIYRWLARPRLWPRRRS